MEEERKEGRREEENQLMSLIRIRKERKRGRVCHM